MQLIEIIYVKAFLIAVIINTVAWGTNVRLNDIKCHSVSPSFAVFGKCEMRTITRNTKEVNIIVKLLKVPVTNVTIVIEIYKRSYTTHSLYNTAVDGCKFMENKKRNPIAIAIYKFFRIERFTNINHTCPYNHDIIISHLPFDKDLNLRLPIGKGDYALKIQGKIQNVLRMRVVVTMQITD
ncbi:hypothetical protein KR093_005945 [Drosophila rubida]|uniref:Uncharacterized protein n=1 Tax=Drosophila rubida TaxID=30044 RepID=A0AAD4K0F1_9MUSC|nr:hypothetical protein KR093_005945 [Drosophila rubida]